MDNGPFEDVFPTKTGGFSIAIYRFTGGVYKGINLHVIMSTWDVVLELKWNFS